MLAYPDLIPKELYSAIEPYYKQMIFYDAPHLAFGYDQPPEGYNPFTDPDLKLPEEVFANFGVWVSSYYDHPDLASRTRKGLDFSKRGPKITLDNMTPEDTKDNFDGDAAGRMEVPMYFVCIQPTLRTQALWDETLVQNVLPELETVHQFCTATNWYCVWGFFENERLLREHNAAGHKVRQIKFIELPGANHHD
ncbi:hypothetical protein CPB85DRAFT_1563892 [Mucidula mucida]|nr:hypothetical protein CPB85DRAFT_1563892 [Mucidula mucida]